MINIILLLICAICSYGILVIFRSDEINLFGANLCFFLGAGIVCCFLTLIPDTNISYDTNIWFLIAGLCIGTSIYIIGRIREMPKYDFYNNIISIIDIILLILPFIVFYYYTFISAIVIFIIDWMIIILLGKIRIPGRRSRRYRRR